MCICRFVVCMYMCMFVCFVCMCICVYVCMCVCVYVCMYECLSVFFYHPLYLIVFFLVLFTPNYIFVYLHIICILSISLTSTCLLFCMYFLSCFVHEYLFVLFF